MWVAEEEENNKGCRNGRTQLVVLDMSSEWSKENSAI